MKADTQSIRLDQRSGSRMPSLGNEPVRLVGVVRTVQHATEADDARPAQLEVRVRCTEPHAASSRTLLLWESSLVLWQHTEPRAGGGALGSRECPFELGIPADVEATIFHTRRTTKETNLRWSLEAVLRYSHSPHTSKPRKATRQRIDLPLALHHIVPYSEIQSLTAVDLTSPSTPLELDGDRRSRSRPSSPTRQAFPHLADDMHGRRSASESRRTPRPPANQAPELAIRCHFVPNFASAPLVVTQSQRLSGPSSYDSGYASGSSPPDTLRTFSSRGRLRSAQLESPHTPVYEEEATPALADAVAAALGSSHRRATSTTGQGRTPAQPLPGTPGGKASSVSSGRRRSSRRPSTCPSLERDPSWIPPVFGSPSPRAS